MTSPYLEQPLRPLAAVLPPLLAQIEAELAIAAGPAEEQWLRQRAELIRGLLAPRQSPNPDSGGRSQAKGRRLHGPRVWRTSRPLPLPPQRP
jgi:hypothetical protein